MTVVTFYEKPGCASNAKQKRLLYQAGIQLDIRNLLAESWTAERLREFFGDLPVAQWFNPSAPRVKNGEIAPATITATQALAEMLLDPLLIRRPLIETRQFKNVGFDWDFLSSALDITDADHHPQENLEKCSHPTQEHRCATERKD